MKHIVEQKLAEAFSSIGIDVSLATVVRSDRADFQCNSLMRFKNRVELANQVIQILVVDNYFESVTVANGFLNFMVSEAAVLEDVKKPLKAIVADKPENIIIDFGGPNIAKPLHVGHMRSANIGEALKRIARELGHTVTGDIHLGDWGTPMGMLLVGIMAENTPPEITTEYLNALYPVVAKLFKEYEVFAAAARIATVNLQNHGIGRDLWEKIKAVSIVDFKKTFDELDVKFDLWNGESDAHTWVEYVLEATKDIAREDQGALVVDVPESSPLMLKNSRGGLTYAVTDLATIYCREQEAPTIILYVVDNRQSLHFKQLFHVANQANITNAKLEHINFGTINGADGKPYKTRDGGVMRLMDFIIHAVKMTEEEAGFGGKKYDNHTHTMLCQIALGAIKFADLCNPRTSDYIFSPDSVKFVGKTGPYIQYSYVRCKSIIDIVGSDVCDTAQMKLLHFTHPSERELSIALMKFNESIQSIFDKSLQRSYTMPHILCDYVYNLCKAFSSFYTECEIIGASDPDTRESRLFLVNKTAFAIKKVLGCLAIPLPEKMIRGDL